MCLSNLPLFHQAQSKGFHSKHDMGVKYATAHQRRFAPDMLKEGRNVIGLQVRTVFVSYTPYTLRYHCYYRCNISSSSSML